jgi:hypothetical protein
MACVSMEMCHYELTTYATITSPFNSVHATQHFEHFKSNKLQASRAVATASHLTSFQLCNYLKVCIECSLVLSK